MAEVTVADELEKADELRQRGVISQAEFDAYKARLLGVSEAPDPSASVPPPSPLPPSGVGSPPSLTLSTPTSVIAPPQPPVVRRIRRSFRLVGVSWRLLQGDRSLVWLPVISSIAILVLAAMTLSPLFVIELGNGKVSNNPAMFGLFVVVYLVVTIVATFFNAALVGAASERLAGRRGKAGDGLRVAWSRIGHIMGWAVLTATFGLALRLLQSRSGVFGIVFRAVQIAWSVATFLVVPVLVCENVGPIDALRRASSLFCQRWGEQLVGEGSIGLALSIVEVIILALTVAGATLAGAVGTAVVVLVVGSSIFIGVVSVGAALSGIFNAALYRYASSGNAAPPYDESDFSGAFRCL